MVLSYILFKIQPQKLTANENTTVNALSNIRFSLLVKQISDKNHEAHS